MKERHIYIAENIIKDYPAFNLKAEENLDRESFSHLRWMLEEVIKNEMSDTKASRWLGYVQGVMAYKGIEDYEKLLDLDNIRNKGDSNVTSHIEVLKQYLNPETGIHLMPEYSQRILNKFNIEVLLKDITEDKWHHADANRIFGIVQGILCCVGYMNVEEERNRTRHLFNGE